MRPYKLKASEPGFVDVIDRSTGERVGYALAGYTQRWSSFVLRRPGDPEFVGTAHYRGEAAELVWSKRPASPSPTENPQ